MAPDLDLLIRSSDDPLLAIEFHRHFTHALVFIPVGALLCALFTYPIAKRSLSFAACYGFSFLGYASHGLLDACTSYGTVLLWPFSHERVAWDLISVVDPVFTVPLIGFVLLGVVRQRVVLALIGCAWCAGYLGLGLLQNERAEAALTELAISRGHFPQRLDVKPSFANILLWRTIYEYDDKYYVDALRMGFGISVFEGGERDVLNLDRDYPLLSDHAQQRRDVERFSWFADDYLAVDPGQRNRIVDLRYALVPNSLESFWGIELDVNAPDDDHAAYVTMRDRSLAEGSQLLRMLLRGDR